MKRTGLSLLEVLISVFILTVGLLSVVALIPVGVHNMRETSKLDHGATVARSSLREAKMMGFLDRYKLCDAGLNANSLIADKPYAGRTFAIDPVVPNMPTDPLLGQTFMIDPLGIARYYRDDGSNPPNIMRFPFVPGGASDQLHIPRLSLTTFPLAMNNAEVRYDFFARVFVSADDAVFEIPEDKDLRPAAQFTFSDGTVSHKVPDPNAAASGAPVPVVKGMNGHYSWLMTAVPCTNDTPDDPNQLHTDHQCRYRVSTAVIYKRNYDFEGEDLEQPRAERRAFVQVLGGGDARLLVDASKYGPEELSLKKNHWLMLFASKADVRLDYNPGVGFPRYRKIAHWYRVVSLDGEPVRETMPDGNEYWTRYVTLDGPDWDDNPGVSGGIPAGLSIDACAFLIDDVIAVHTTELEVE